MEVIVIIWVACIVTCGVMANKKERSTIGWILLGALFGIFSVIAILALPSLARDPSEPSLDTHTRCPDCRELVRIDARVCRHCQRSLVTQPQ